MPKVIHLVPYDSIGGVEIAARSMRRVKRGDIDFTVDYIFEGVGSAQHRRLTNSPLALISAAKRVLDESADLLIVSLWRSCIVGLVAKVFNPKLSLIVFLHSDKDVHWLDYAFTRIAAHYSIEVWADSNATLSKRISSSKGQKGRVISFVTSRLQPLDAKPVCANFIFWGRISPEKGLDRALNIFSKVQAQYGNAKFTVIGPDCGQLDRIKCLAESLELIHAVKFFDGMTMEEIIQQASSALFYLQTSLFEGMAMSVVEAMQLGLLPIVTPVGEISTYCQNGENALIVDTDEQAVAGILALLEDNLEFQRLRENATSTWLNTSLYIDSVMDSCRCVLDSSVLNKSTDL